MNLEGDQSLIHAALVQKLGNIMKTPQAVSSIDDEELADLEGSKGTNLED